MNAVQPGELRHQVQIQRRTTAPDTFGQQQATWRTIARAWASIEPFSIRETATGRQLASQVTHRIVMRYQECGLIAGMRIAFSSHLYLVQGVENPGLRNIYVELTCLEVNGAE